MRRLFLIGCGMLCLTAAVIARQVDVEPVYAQASTWDYAESCARDAVVQVWCQSATFNWSLPYKSPDQTTGAGSGFIIDNEGHILTNYHVVRDATSVYISVPKIGQARLEVKITGVCPELDIALLSLTDESFVRVKEAFAEIPYLRLGNSDAVRAPQEVLALGFPLGFQTLKCTKGDIAGTDFLLGRSLMHTTAPISQGNSGGPLLTPDGKVIGVNSASLVQGQNYNYIVPSSEVVKVLPELFVKPLVRKLQWCMGTNPTTDAHAYSLGNPDKPGLYINKVYDGTLEKEAGLCAGDMLYALVIGEDRYEVDAFGDVLVSWRDDKISVEELLSRCREGDEVTFIVYRNGAQYVLSCACKPLTLDPVRTIYPEYEQHEIGFDVFGGLVVMQLRLNHIERLMSSGEYHYAQKARSYAKPENQSKHALIITAVLPGSVAHLSKCFLPGYILDTVNNSEVTTLKELRTALAKSGQTGEIDIALKDGPHTVLSLADVCAKESYFAQICRYAITPGMQQLMQAV